MKDIVIIGSGNVATQLGVVLQEKGIKVRQVWSKQMANANLLANQLSCLSTDNLQQLVQADLYLIAVKDDALGTIIEELPNVPIVHTSGSIGLEVFTNRFSNCGVFYPLQSFRKEVLADFSSVPLLVEANHPNFELQLIAFGSRLSTNVQKLSAKQRLQLHIAAVFANNFSNHLFSISANILNKNGLDFRLLLPLIQQSVQSLQNHQPFELQTGPAKRKDFLIIKKHLENIHQEDWNTIYQILTQSIINQYE